jgi:hypothetical protein
MFPAPHARTGESFPHPVVSYIERGGRESTFDIQYSAVGINRRLSEWTDSNGVRLRAGTISGLASRALTPACSNRDRLGEPLDIRNIVRLLGVLITGI